MSEKAKSGHRRDDRCAYSFIPMRAGRPPAPEVGYIHATDP